MNICKGGRLGRSEVKKCMGLFLEIDIPEKAL
jgi:hypothetical protein